jgi:hypothetical protein
LREIRNIACSSAAGAAGTRGAIALIEQGDGARAKQGNRDHEEAQRDQQRKHQRPRRGRARSGGRWLLPQEALGSLGGWYKPRYNHCKKYESYEPEYKEESSDYESSDYSEPAATGGNAQIVNVAVTVNVAQVQD